MKLVFLDIDGVANSSRSVIAKIGPTFHSSDASRDLWHFAAEDGEDAPEYGCVFGLKTVDPVCVALINKLIDGDDVGLVLSSTHRKFLWNSKVPYGSPEHLARLRTYLTAMGFHVPALFDITPVLHSKRGDEIDAWLNDKNTTKWGFDGDVDGWVVLDDSADMLPYQPLVLVDATHGFSFANYAEACRHLGLKEPGMVLL